jgi:hypothetical protein
MLSYELNLTSNKYYRDKKHGVKDFANLLPVNFNGVNYSGDRDGSNYTKGRFSLFLRAKDSDIGYKIFVGFRDEDKGNDHIKVYSEDNILVIKKVYDILSKYNLCPKVSSIFSVNINIYGHSYISYGLEMKNVIKIGKGSKVQFKDFKIKLKEVCEKNGLRRLSRRDRRDIIQGIPSSGSVDNIMYEASTKADNVVFDGDNYILLDIDPVWVIL